MKRKIDSIKGRLIYNRRLGIAEPPFAHIKSILRLDRFTLRGKRKVNTQWLLYVCDNHMSHIRSGVAPDFPSVAFLMGDYVTGSVSAAQIANGYTDFLVLADVDQSVLDLYQATMGTTMVIDSSGIVRMNEDYKDGTRLREVLEVLP